MSIERTFRNVIGGPAVARASGEDYDVIESSTGGGVRPGAFPGSGSATPRDRSSALPEIAGALEDYARIEHVMSHTGG